MSEYKMTVEVPVVVEIDIDESLVPNETEGPERMREKGREWVKADKPTPELKRAVKDALESDTVHVKGVYRAMSFSTVAIDGGVG